jgi:hypothetical protein
MLIKAELLSEDVLQNAVKVSGVRNPYDLLVSRYIKMQGRIGEANNKYKWAQNNDKLRERIAMAKTMDFPAWLRQTLKEFKDKNKTVRGPLIYINPCDLVIQFEHLQAGFDEFLKRIGVSQSISVVEYNVTSERKEGGKKRDFREFYDAESVELVRALYAPVIKRFGYRFEAEAPVPESEPTSAATPAPRRSRTVTASYA